MKPEQVQVGWLVETTGGPMFFAQSDYAEAVLYCEDGAEPVVICCDKAELGRHNEAQEVSND